MNYPVYLNRIVHLVALFVRLYEDALSTEHKIVINVGLYIVKTIKFKLFLTRVKQGVFVVLNTVYMHPVERIYVCITVKLASAVQNRPFYNT